MATGMQYIHSKGIVHRDMNPCNILISKTLPVCLMISDFGISTPIDHDGTFPMNACGAQSWMAPEVLEILSDNLSARGTVKCDIWALGCLFFYFLTKGKHPYGNDGGSFVIQANVFYGSPFVLDGTVFCLFCDREPLSSYHYVFFQIPLVTFLNFPVN